MKPMSLRQLREPKWEPRTFDATALEVEDDENVLLLVGHTPGSTEGAGEGVSGMTDVGPSALRLALELKETEQAVHARARQIAAQLSLPKPRTDRALRRGGRDYVTLPYHEGASDLDLDRTLEVLAENPAPGDEDLFVRERIRGPRAVVLLVDVSGSMRGERVNTAAATVGALASELEQDQLSVIAFWADAALLLRFGDPVQPMQILDTLLRIPAKGLTNIAYPLELAAEQFTRTNSRDSRVLLLSDCVHVAGPDPRPYAARLPRLDVLLDVSGAKDVPLGRELARAGRGTFRAIRRHGDVAPALSEIFRS